MAKKLTALVIMDGFGLSNIKEGNAVYEASTPNIDRLMKEYPSGQINASGLDVGLPEGQMGNSEVGHLNLGAGRISIRTIPVSARLLKMETSSAIRRSCQP